MSHHKRNPTGKAKQKKRQEDFEKIQAEKDAIRGIVKDLNSHDLLTGEIIYSLANEVVVRQALAFGTFQIELPHFESKHIKSKPERLLLEITSEAIEENFHYDYGEVLNRGITPCWWR